jgi:hypothetical protein
MGTRTVKTRKRKCALTGGASIFTDYDDTAVCAGRAGIAGSDTSLPRHTPYPGQAKLYEVLMTHRRAKGDELYVLTARPHILAVAKNARAMQKEACLHRLPIVLWGNMHTSIQWAIAVKSGVKDMEMVKKALGHTKFTAWHVHAFRKNRLRRTVFFGDDGQGDVHAAVSMIDFALRHSRGRLARVSPIFRAYIHRVVGPPHCSPAKIDAKYAPYIKFYVDSLDAAQDARQHRLIGDKDLQKVRDAYTATAPNQTREETVVCAKRRTATRRKRRK